MTTTTAPTPDRVRRVIAEHFGIAQADVTPEKSIVGDLNGDSLDRVELVMAIEDEFDLEIADEEGELCNTVADCIALVERRLAR
jgi:acyl carrier protein